MRRDKTVQRALAALFFIALFSSVWFLVSEAIGRFEAQDRQFASLAQENKELRLQIRGLEMIAGEDGRFILLQKELIRIAGQKLGVYLPDVTHKVFELEERFREDNLTPDLMLALMEIESAFDPSAVSTFVDSSGNTRKLAYGLTQVIRSTARPYLADLGYDWSPEILQDPRISMEVGFRHLVDLHRQNVSEGLEDPEEYQWSIMMYFWGERHIKTAMNTPSKSRKETPAFGYWWRVREAQNGWREKGFGA
jgi:hypothetical protein